MKFTCAALEFSGKPSKEMPMGIRQWCPRIYYNNNTLYRYIHVCKVQVRNLANFVHTGCSEAHW